MKTTIKFPKSDSFAFFVTINKIAKALDNAFFTVKENPDEEPVLQKKLGAGISLADSRLYKNQLSYKVQINGADTANMEVGVRYFFDVKGTIGNAQKTFLWGELILSDTETGYLNPAMQGDTVAVAQVYTATFETGAQSQYVETEVDPVATAKIGDMMKLNTTAKDTLVKAINEVNTPAFTEAATRENIVSGEKQSTLWGKVKKWFSSLKALAFKDKVETADFATSAKCPSATSADKADIPTGFTMTRLPADWAKAHNDLKDGTVITDWAKTTDNQYNAEIAFVVTENEQNQTADINLVIDGNIYVREGMKRVYAEGDNVANATNATNAINTSFTNTPWKLGLPEDIKLTEFGTYQFIWDRINLGLIYWDGNIAVNGTLGVLYEGTASSIEDGATFFIRITSGGLVEIYQNVSSGPVRVTTSIELKYRKIL